MEQHRALFEQPPPQLSQQPSQPPQPISSVNVNTKSKSNEPIPNTPLINGFDSLDFSIVFDVFARLSSFKLTFCLQYFSQSG